MPAISSTSSVPIAAALRDARSRSGMRIGEFAAAIGYSRPHLSAVETGKIYPSKALVMAYERQLGLPPGSLVDVLVAQRGLAASATKRLAASASVDQDDQVVQAVFAALAVQAANRLSPRATAWLADASIAELTEPHLELRRAGGEFAAAFYTGLAALPDDRRAQVESLVRGLLLDPVPKDGAAVDVLVEMPTGGATMQDRHRAIPILTPEDDELQQTVIVTAGFGDNQFAPVRVAQDLFQKASSRYEPEMFSKIDAVVDSSLKLSLLNGGAVLVNRAYFLNNRSLFKNYLPGAPERDAVIELLDKRAILPWLYRERQPDEIPEFQVATEGSRAWVDVLREARNAAAVRLAADDEENRRLTATLASKFHENIRNFEGRTIEGYLADFGLEATKRNVFLLASLLRLAGDVAGAAGWARRWQGGAPAVSREDLYRVFISTVPAESRYDGGALLADDPAGLMKGTTVEEATDAVKAVRARFGTEVLRGMLPFVKELIDLAYAVPLADMTGAFTLTAPGSAERRTLQEFRHALSEFRGGAVQLEQLQQLLEAEIFADVMRTLSPIGLNALLLDDVVKLRETEEWAHYQLCLRNLIAKAPLVFKEEANAVCEAYNALLRRAPGGEREWQSAVGVAIAAAGQTLNLMWTKSKTIVWNVQGLRDDRAAAPKTAPVTGQLVLGDEDARSGWLSKLDFLAGSLPQPAKSLGQLVDELENNSRATQGPVFWQRGYTSTMNAPDSQP